MKPGLPKKTFLAACVLLASGFVTASGGVMMQGFYWDVPGNGTWYNTMKEKAYGLRYMLGGAGIDRIWFPPVSKGASGGYSMGYDPYDYYDLGQYDQKGTVKTRFGSQAELRAAIAEFKKLGVLSMADIVLNHRSNAEKKEVNPRTGGETWTDFSSVASGKMNWHWDSFHPNSYCGGDESAYGGYLDVCHRSGRAYNDFKEWLNWLKDPANAGFTGGWRYDYVKGYPAWVNKDMNAATGGLMGVGEYWDRSMPLLDRWASEAGSSVLDFPLYYTLRDVLNDTSGGGWLPDLFDPAKGFASKWDARSVTFVGNHDTDEIFADKMMAYAFILTYKGYPCLYWKDYFDYGLAAGGGAGQGEGNGIKRLVWAREKLAAGGPNIQILKSDDGDWISYGSYGYSAESPGYIVVINDSPSAWKGGTVNTGNAYLKNKVLKAYAWSSAKSGQNYQPANQFCDGGGNVQVWAPPRGYAVYSADGITLKQ
ncbi:MAG TPA: alpha-amylase family glycosyl hydrolase [Elusimicrobiales bacterium]|nr:alpha-amylase family glycosyl hydrolase [Elusimicrobiales bacterium]